MQRIIAGTKEGSCLECPDITMIGVGGLWAQCVVTKEILGNINSRPSGCPYLKAGRDAGDSLLDAIMGVSDEELSEYIRAAIEGKHD